MITIHACSKNDSTVLTKTIDPKSKDEFDNDISVFCAEASRQLGRFYLDFDDSEATVKQALWVEDENS
jgi:hypothetical protein